MTDLRDTASVEPLAYCFLVHKPLSLDLMPIYQSMPAITPLTTESENKQLTPCCSASRSCPKVCIDGWSKERTAVAQHSKVDTQQYGNVWYTYNLNGFSGIEQSLAI